jgi:hypothetical protein
MGYILHKIYCQRQYGENKTKCQKAQTGLNIAGLSGFQALPSFA